VKIKLMAKSLFFCGLIFLLFSPSAFPWQIAPFQQVKDFAVEKEKNQINLNLVFAGLGYHKEDEFKKDISLILTRLKNTPPFDEFKGLKVYLLDAGLDEKAILFKESEKFPYLKVRNDLIQSLENKLSGVYKLVILNKEGKASAAELSSIKDISLIILGRDSYGQKNRLAKAFLHEFGHSLGLREENSRISRQIIPGEPNCAPDKETAVKWWGDMAEAIDGVDYFEFQFRGNKFIKPTRHSIMNNPFKSSGYGQVNEKYLRRELGFKKNCRL